MAMPQFTREDMEKLNKMIREKPKEASKELMLMAFGIGVCAIIEKQEKGKKKSLEGDVV